MSIAFRLVALCCLLSPSGLAVAADAIAFDTEGGDAWTHLKTLTGSIDPHRCDTVIVSAGHSQVRATLSGSEFTAVVPLQAGNNEVVGSCRKLGREHVRTSPQSWQVQLPDVPKAWIRVRPVDDELLLDARRSELAPGSPAPIRRIHWRMTNAAGAMVASTDESLPRMPIPHDDGEYRIELTIEDGRDRSDRSAALLDVRDGRAHLTDRAAWFDSATLYGVIPFFYGGFDGVRERLDEIAALGVTALWISPVTATSGDDFGYAPIDHFRLRDTFGDERAFRALLHRAHELGLKVLLDLVPNHFSDRHRYSLSVQRAGERSPYFDWFDRDSQGAITHYFDWQHLHNLNLDAIEVRNYLLAASAHWLRNFAVDGYRVDAAWGISQRAPEFWEQWRDELKRIEPRALLLAEAAPHHARAFDAAYDWSMQVGEWSWREVFHDAQTVPDLDRLRTALRSGEASKRLRFINNNDTGARFISRYGVHYARLAAALTLTLPGIPLIFNGDEVGAEFEPYDEGPVLQWRDEHQLTPFYRELIALRRELPALRGADLQVLRTTTDDRVLAFARPMPRCVDDVLVLMNFSARPLTTRVSTASAARRWQDVRSGTSFAGKDRRVSVELAPYGWRMLRAEACSEELAMRPDTQHVVTNLRHEDGDRQHARDEVGDHDGPVTACIAVPTPESHTEGEDDVHAER